MRSRAIAMSALLVSALFPSVLNSSAADINTYEPTIYFRTQPAENVTALPTGRLYINSKKIPDGIAINAEAYYLDEMKATNMLYVKWQCDSEVVRLKNLTDPITATGYCPFKKWSDPANINLSYAEEGSLMSVSYPSTSATPLALTGESSDSYPLACFDVEIPGNAPAGLYEVFFRQGDMGDVSNASYGEPLRDIRPTGEHAPSLFIGVSDRDLGDVNGSGKLEATDASMVLVAYTKLTENGKSGLSTEQEIAAEMNGDGLLTAADASLILVKYADLT